MSKSIGQIARDLIAANPTMKNVDLLAMVKAHPEYPVQTGKTTVACIAWYKNAMKDPASRYFHSGEQQAEETPRTSEVIREEIAELSIELSETLEREAQEKIENAAMIQLEIERLMKLLPQEQQPTQ